MEESDSGTIMSGAGGMLSRAHARSAYAVLDPTYDPLEPRPEPAFQKWLYPRGCYERNMLVRMYNDMMAARLLVGYDMSRNYMTYGSYHYRRHVAAGRLEFEAASAYTARLDGRQVAAGDGGHVVIEVKEGGLMEVDVHAVHHRFLAPALASADDGWEASSDDCPEFGRAERGGPPAWDTSLPSVEIPLAEFRPGCFDLGREVFALIEIHCLNRPECGFGESLPEMENRDWRVSEQMLELISRKPGVWTPVAPVACRYVRVESAEPFTVACRGMYTPACYHGAFASDEQLTRIWMNSAYTLRLCMYHFLIDGIKRDRLPWMGDLLASMLANAYTFGDGSLCRRTLTVLGAPGIKAGHINGLADFTLWLPVASHHYQLYWGDGDFLKLQYREIKETMACLLERADGAYLDCNGDRVFIDWTDEEKSTACQVLFHYSLKAAARLSERAGDMEFARRLEGHAASLRERLLARSFDEGLGLFYAGLENPSSGFNRYANMLAVLGGLVEGDVMAGIGAFLAEGDAPEVGTPFMAGLEILAMHRAGRTPEALARLRSIWGSMLDAGATSFWEGYSAKETGDERYSFYSRPFGKSLCHAWSSGPAFLLPQLLFGCEPLEDGWRSFAVKDSGLLKEGDSACIPTPLGRITLDYIDGKIRAAAPEGAKAVCFN